jgi:hypothetical protein
MGRGEGRREEGSHREPKLNWKDETHALGKRSKGEELHR